MFPFFLNLSITLYLVKGLPEHLPAAVTLSGESNRFGEPQSQLSPGAGDGEVPMVCARHLNKNRGKKFLSDTDWDWRERVTKRG